MTKHIHIINGDSTEHKVSVITQELQDGEWIATQEEPLNISGQLVTKVIWKERRLVVEERV